MTAARPPVPAVLRGPGIVLLAILVVSWRVAGGDLAALGAPQARDALLGLARGFLPPAHDRAFLTSLAGPLLDTVAIAVAGLGLALVLALPIAWLAVAPRVVAAPGRRPARSRVALWAAARGLLNLMRSVPEVIWALVLVRALGLGPAAGVAAIGIAYAGVLGKVLAEIVESAPREPAAALAAAGATPLRAFVHGTLPGVFPLATSYVLYRLDCALRASAVLGLVGAGGIGVQLELALKMLAYDEVAAMICALLAVVAAVDVLSALVRGRLRRGHGPLPSGRAGLPRAAVGVAAGCAAFAAAAARLELPAGELLSAAPLRSLAAFLARSYPPDLDPAYLRRVGPAILETLAVSVVGTAVAAALGLALAWAAAPPLAGALGGGGPARRAGRAATAWAARGAMNLLRTMPELLWALLLVLAVGLGPFAGALALGLHTAGVLGRLYAEALEEVAPEPALALTGLGAGRGAAALFAVLPQVAPQLVAYTLYRWEVNVRASAVLGVVGAGGLGTLLQLSLGLFHVHRTLTLVLAVVALVTAVDLASGVLRARLVEGAGPSREVPVHRRSAVAAVALLLLFAPAAAIAAEPLRVSAIPDESPTELQRKFEPLGAYLREATGREVRFVAVTDYAATVEGLAAGKLDLVWYGGFTFVQARRRTGNAIPLVQRVEDARFHSKFIVGAASKARTLADLKGGSFAFGAVSSTSGHLMPRHFLLKEGIDPDRDFSRVGYSGAHDVTARWVEAGKVDAGVLNESIWQKLVDEGKVDAARVRVLATTPPYHDYNWTVRGDLDPAIVDALRRAFVALDPANPAHRRILELQRASRFIPTAPENYAGIEQAARAAGLLKD